MTKGVTSGICPVGKYATNNALLSSIMKSDRKILDCYSCNNKTRSSQLERKNRILDFLVAVHEILRCYLARFE